MNDTETHIEKTLNTFRGWFHSASERIDVLKPGEHIAATKLAEDIGIANGMTMAQFYPFIKVMLIDYPGVLVKAGSKGGIFKLPIPEKDSK